MSPRRLKALLESVRRGELTPEGALLELRSLPFESMEGAIIDHHRALRCGHAEVVLALGKTAAQVASATSWALEPAKSSRRAFFRVTAT